MKAGRELDALVAEHVMGWYWLAETPELPRALVSTDESETRAYYPHTGQGAPPYSTSISDAWMVVEKLRADGFSVAHQGPFPPEWEEGREWWEFMHEDGRGGQAYEDEDTRAICLAALKAVGIDTESLTSNQSQG